MASAATVCGIFDRPQLAWTCRRNRAYQRRGDEDGHVDARVRGHYDCSGVDVRGFYVSVCFLLLLDTPGRQDGTRRPSQRRFELAFFAHPAFRLVPEGVNGEANARSYFGLMSVLAVLVR